MSQVPKDTDSVTLVAILKGGSYVTCPWTRKEAGDFIREWWAARTALVRGKLPEPFQARSIDDALEWLEGGTVIGNCRWAFAVEELVGCYTMEDRLSAQERIAAAVEKAAKGDLPGDEWKRGNEE